MKKYSILSIFTILTILLSSKTFAKLNLSNNNDITKEFINDKSEIVSSEKEATAYRIYQPDETFIEYKMNGKKSFSGKWFDKAAKKLDGCCTWFLPDGNVDAEKCYVNGIYKRPIVTIKHKISAWNGVCKDCILPRNDKDLIVWDTVVNLKGSTDILYEKAKYVLSSFESLGQKENIIKANDEQKNVDRRLSFPFTYVRNTGQWTGAMVFNCTIYCKENRYKIRLHDFIFVPKDNSESPTLETLFNLASKDMSTLMMANYQNQAAIQIFNYIEGYKSGKLGEVLGIFEDIPEKMSFPLSDMRKKQKGEDVTDEKW